jgi:hypothetical protein
MKLKTLLFPFYWLLSVQFGIDPGKMFSSLRGLPRYVHDLFRFRSNYTGHFGLLPCLYDWYEDDAGATRSEYFWQDLLVARKIFAANPKKHVDIGSRVDGFVAHVASFREIEVFDIRPIATQIPGVTFKQADIMKPVEGMTGYCDSLSCLHALEHFGLGRYGDTINPLGYELGMQNIAKILQQGGLFYLSVPIGIERVEFNARRIFDPRKLVQLADSFGLTLKEFASMRAGEVLVQSSRPWDTIIELSGFYYSLGIFVFIKQ